MKSASVNIEMYRRRITLAVDDIMAKEEIFREQLHRRHLISRLTTLFETLPAEIFQAMNEHELSRRVGLLRSDQLVADLLDKEAIRLALTPGASA